MNFSLKMSQLWYANNDMLVRTLSSIALCYIIYTYSLIIIILPFLEMITS